MSKVCTTTAQKKLIHKLVNELAWSDEVYKTWLCKHIGYESVMFIYISEASRVIELLKLELEIKTGSPTKITPKQVSYIKYLWLDVDYDNGNSGDVRLSSFLLRKFNVERAEYLTKDQAHGAISAIKRMKRNLDDKTHVSRCYSNEDGTKSIYIKTELDKLQECRIIDKPSKYES